MKTLSPIVVGSLCFASSLFSACGNQVNPLRTLNVQVADSGTGDDPLLTLSAQLNLGNASLEQIEVPVVDPRSGRALGRLSLASLPQGGQQVTLALSASAALNADPALGRTLPNGRELPLSLGVRPGEMLAFPILNHSRIYIGGDLKERVFLGAALAIRALDGVANSAGMALNLFFGLNVNPSLYGVAGLYGSPVANQSGVAVFGRLNRSAMSPGVNPVADQKMLVSSAVVSARSARVSVPVAEVPDEMNSRSQRRVLRLFQGAPRVLKVE